MEGTRSDWPRSHEYIALDYEVAVHDVFGPGVGTDTPSRHDAIFRKVGGRQKVLSQATVAELLVKARMRMGEEEVAKLLTAIRMLYTVAACTDELCLSFSAHKRKANSQGVDLTHDRVWTAAICSTTAIPVLVIRPADYGYVLTRDHLVTL